MKNNILQVLNKKACCGCGACVNVCEVGALEYSKDENGFIIPKLYSEECVSCGKCIDVCAAENSEKYKPIKAYAAMAIDKSDRYNSSSGGIFGVIAKNFIESDGVVFGAKMDENFQVYHSSASTKSELKELLRSKYIQSDMRKTYKDILECLKGGRKVLFSGTPCQVSAVRNYIPQKYKKNLYLIDIVCHGVPSQEFFNSYISYLSFMEGEINSYTFRAKRQVDNGMNCFFSYKKKNNSKVLKNWPEDTFNYLYMKSYIYRDSCYGCQYATKDRCSDITLCDFWGWNNYHINFKFGSTVSGILINSNRGIDIIEAVKNRLIIENTDIENIRKHNGCLVKPSEYSEKREQIFKIWKNSGFAYIDEYYKAHNKIVITKSRIMRRIPASIMNVLIKMRLKMLP